MDRMQTKFEGGHNSKRCWNPSRIGFNSRPSCTGFLSCAHLSAFEWLYTLKNGTLLPLQIAKNHKKMRNHQSWNFSKPPKLCPGISLCPCGPALVNLPALYKAPPHPLLLWCCWKLGPWKLEILKRTTRLLEDGHRWLEISTHQKSQGNQ